MTEYVLMAATIVSGVLKTMIHGVVSRKTMKNTADTYLFNVIVFGTIGLIFLAASLMKPFPSVYTLLMGLLFGAINMAFQALYSRAMGIGPVSITILINAFSLVLPTLLGVLVWQEVLSAYQWAGILILLISIYLLVNPRKNKNIGMKWILLCTTTFFLAGAISIMQKTHQSSLYKGELTQFLTVTFLCAVALSLLGCLIRMRRAGERLSPHWTRKAVALSVLCGAALALYQLLSLYLAGIMDISILYPVTNGGMIILSMSLSAVFFKDMLSVKQKTGLVMGVGSILLIGNAVRLLLG